MIDLITRINDLWAPVYPHLAEHIGEIYGRRNGRVLDVGPFSGTVFELLKKGTGDSFLIAPFLTGMTDVYRQKIKGQGLEHRIGLVETDSTLAAFRDHTIDLLVFRGALFFPALFRTDLSVMYRVLKPGGIGFVGGGFGKHTPPSVIEAIGDESRDLNLRLGKTAVTAEEIWREVKGKEVEKHMEVISEGGLWAVIQRKV